MHTTGKIKEKVLNAAILAGMLFVFSAQAHAKVTASPTVVNFGNQAAGTTSAPRTITLTNTGRRNNTIHSASMSGENFSYSGLSLPITLAPGRSLTFSVAYKPDMAEWNHGTMVLTRLNGTTTRISLNGTGARTQTKRYTISATPFAFSFSVHVGEGVAAKSVRIDDTTPGPLPFMLSVDQPWITVSATSGNTRANGDVMQFGVNPAGLAAGSYIGHVIVTSSGVTNSPLRVPVTLTVSSGAAVPPAITMQPSSQTIAARQAATFTVVATGTAPLTYQWKKNGVAMAGGTSSSYKTSAMTTSDNATKFTVVVTNRVGNATSTAAILTINAATSAPSITGQPASQTVKAGQTATFTVAATGTAPITYQWKKNGTAISGATSSTYTTAAEITSDNGAKFSVTLSNSAGNSASTQATLSVNATALALNASSTALSFGNVTLPTSGSQNVTLTNSGNSNITISNVSVSGAGFNASGLPSGLILNPGKTATMAATFTPATTGSVTGSVTISSNASNSPNTIALSGAGRALVKHSVVLSWTPSTSTVAGYYTYVSTKSGGPYVRLSTTPVLTTSYTDATVQAGYNYYYVVTAVDSNRVESAFSAEISANVP